MVGTVGTDNSVGYSFDKKFVDVSPASDKMKSFANIGRWYDDGMLYYCQHYKFALY